MTSNFPKTSAKTENSEKAGNAQSAENTADTNSEVDNRVHRFISNDLTLRAAVVNSTAVVREMQVLQKTYPLPTVAVGRCMTGALLMAAQLKNGQSVGVHMRGNGALGTIYAEAHFEGDVRGFTHSPQYQPPNYNEGLSLHKAVGNGTLTVSRQQPFQKQPHYGTVDLVNGEVGDDIAHYLNQSHQIRSLVALGVSLSQSGSVEAAGGLLLEVMPGVEDEIVDLVMKNRNESRVDISQMIKEGFSPQQILEPLLKGIPFSSLDHPFTVRYSCPCDKERVLRAIEILGVKDLTEMVDDGEPVPVVCQMCGKPYDVTVSDMKDIRDRLHRNSLN